MSRINLKNVLTEYKKQNENVENMILKVFTDNYEDNEKSESFYNGIKQDFNSISPIFPSYTTSLTLKKFLIESIPSQNMQIFNDTKLKFTIQLFRSGRTFPIIYLQLFEKRLYSIDSN